MTGCAIRFQGQFVLFDVIFRLAARAGDVPGEHLGTGLLQSSAHKACVDALVPDFHLDHDAARAHPRPGLVTRRVKACDLVPTSFIGALGLLNHLPGQLLQDGVTGQASDRTESRLVLDPLPHLGIGKVAVTAKDQKGMRPGLPPPFAEPFQHGKPLRACDTRGLEDGRHQASRETRIEVQRHKTLPAIITNGVSILHTR